MYGPEPHSCAVLRDSFDRLKKLNLMKNNIGYDGAKAIHDVLLTKNKTLEQLNLYTNKIGNMKQAIEDATSNRKFSIKA